MGISSLYHVICIHTLQETALPPSLLQNPHGYHDGLCVRYNPAAGVSKSTTTLIEDTRNARCSSIICNQKSYPDSRYPGLMISDTTLIGSCTTRRTSLQDFPQLHDNKKSHPGGYIKPECSSFSHQIFPTSACKFLTTSSFKIGHQNNPNHQTTHSQTILLRISLRRPRPLNPPYTSHSSPFRMCQNYIITFRCKHEIILDFIPCPHFRRYKRCPWGPPARKHV